MSYFKKLIRLTCVAQIFFLRASALVELSVLRCRGDFQVSNILHSENTIVPTAFLSRGRLEVIENRAEEKKDKVIVCDLFPIPLRYETGCALFYSMIDTGGMKIKQISDLRNLCGILINRDGGIFDNTPYFWGSTVNPKKDIYNYLSGGQWTSAEVSRFSNIPEEYRSSPHSAFQFALSSILGANIIGLLVESADEYLNNAVKLGAAVVISRTATSDKWQISSKQSKLPTEDEKEEAVVVPCHMDELLGFSIGLGLPICIQKDLFEGLAVDAIMSKDESSNKIYIKAPFNRKGKDPIKTASKIQSENGNAKPAWEIFDPLEFLKMSTADKRATLRASNVRSLPRPREGDKVLDQMLLDLADDAVRREVLRLRGEDSGGGSMKIRTSDGISFATEDGFPVSGGWGENKRQIILREMAEALEKGEMARAEKLRERFATLTALKADPTQAEGSYSRFLDQDDWYLEERRRAMRPKQ